MRQGWTLVVFRGVMAALCGGLVLGLSCPGCPVPPTEQSLIQQATDRARTLDPDAIVFQVTGVNGASFDGTGSETLSYTFQALDPNDPTVMYELSHDKTDWTNAQTPLPVGGAAYYDLLQVAMTEADARTLLENAGHEDDFHGWSLYKPLYSSSTDPIYVFNYGDKAVMINAVSQAVTVVQFSTPEPPVGIGPGEDSVSLQMIAAADTEIKRTSAGAIIIWCGGRDGDGNPLQQPADTNVWDCVAIEVGPTGTRAWTLRYDGTWTTEALLTPPFGIEFQDLARAVTMDVVEAWSLAAGAGYSPPFQTWQVFKPLNPTVANPVYALAAPGGHVIVDTVTGEVSFE